MINTLPDVFGIGDILVVDCDLSGQTMTICYTECYKYANRRT